MRIKFQQLAESDFRDLLSFLTSDTWPFHGGARPEPGKIRELFKNGYYLGDDAQTFWILLDGEKVGLIRIFDLQDNCPMFDLRILGSHRGKGIGKKALKWLMEYVFTTWPEKWRIEGQTRNDNIAMRRVFRQCGWVKEAHYRKAWPAPNGELFDSIGYGVLREDWEAGIITPVDWDDEEKT